jgi:hypothetical protein
VKAGSRAAKRADRQAGKAVRKAASRSTPRSQVLPGLRGARSQKLDNLCEAIGEQRDAKNEATVQEDSLTASALQEMQKRKLQVYKHAGLELARVPGSERLRVRRVKDTGDAAVEQGATSADNAEQGGDATMPPTDELSDADGDDVEGTLGGEIH